MAAGRPGRQSGWPVPRLDGFAKLVGRFIPRAMFEGLPQRQRVFTPWVTFCAFLVQVLQRDCACREIVQRVQASRLMLGKAAASNNTSAYCQARGKLGLATPFARLMKRW